jgi:hypothetical protein
MSPLYFFLALLVLGTLHLSYVLPVTLWVLNYTQPFALEYFKDWLSNRRK